MLVLHVASPERLPARAILARRVPRIMDVAVQSTTNDLDADLIIILFGTVQKRKKVKDNGGRIRGCATNVLVPITLPETVL